MEQEGTKSFRFHDDVVTWSRLHSADVLLLARAGWTVVRVRRVTVAVAGCVTRV